MQLRARLQHTLGSTYTLGPELGGQGAFAFLAEEASPRRTVLVKLLPPELAAGLDAERFRREIEVAALLHHDHIVPVLTAGRVPPGSEGHADDDRPYYTTAHLDGEPLRDRLARDGPLPVGTALWILRDVARALAYGHALGAVHRDLRPDTVWLARGRALVTDFGVASAIEASRVPSDVQVGPRAPHGAPLAGLVSRLPYVSPEEAAGDGRVDHRADLYAFGCLAYELLTGAPPFVEPSRQRLLAAHMARPPVPVSTRRLETPPALAGLVMCCLAKDSERRPPSAAELVRDLEAMTSSALPSATPSAPVARVADAPAAPAAGKRRAPGPLGALSALVRRLRS